MSLLHTLFAREHNAICDRLKVAYPHWDDNRLFNVARLVNAAVMAKIHTVEWTPSILPNPGLNAALNANWFGILTNLFSYGRDRDTLGEINIRNPELGGVVGNPPTSTASPMAWRCTDSTHCCRGAASQAAGEATSWRRKMPVPATRQAGSRKLTNRFGIADIFYSFGTQHPGQLVLNNFPSFMQELSIPGNPLFDMAAVDILRRARARSSPVQRIPAPTGPESDPHLRRPHAGPRAGAAIEQRCTAMMSRASTF